MNNLHQEKKESRESGYSRLCDQIPSGRIFQDEAEKNPISRE